MSSYILHRPCGILNCIIFIVLFLTEVVHGADTAVKGGVKGGVGTKSNACNSKPERPLNGGRRCTKSVSPTNVVRMSCTAKCNEGFEFPNGESSILHECNTIIGGWTPTWKFPDCQPVCRPPCKNGGICAGNDHCVCPRGFRGPACEYSMDLCSPKHALQFHGKFVCNSTDTETSCLLFCPHDTSPHKYRCSLEGRWSPPKAPKCQADIKLEMQADSPGSGGILSVGSKSPPHRGICTTWNQQHYRTFDGYFYSFKSPCTYVLVKDCAKDTFSIDVTNSKKCFNEGDCQTKVSVYVDSHPYTLTMRDNEPVLAQGGSSIPIPGSHNGLVVEKLAHFVVITSSLGFRLEWDGGSTVSVKVNEDMKNRTCGLCGRYNGLYKDDLQLDDGTIADNIMKFSRNWKRTGLGETCDDLVVTNDYCISNTKSGNIHQDKSEEYCNYILDPKFSACHQLIDARPYYETCLKDCCYQKQVQSSCTCNSFAEYFRQCTRLGGKINGGWRSPSFCPLQCSGGMVYDDCGSSCPRTCDGQRYNCEHEDCVDGCHCPLREVLHNGQCIKQESCPCDLRGKKYTGGEKVEVDCNICECQGGKWLCTNKICNARCSLVGDPHYTTFDGLKYKFLGSCSYYLVYNNEYSIIQENDACNLANDQSTKGGSVQSGSMCTRALIVVYNGTTIKLKQQHQVLMNDKKVASLPLKVSGMHIYMASSLYLEADLLNGIKILWDGKSTAHIDVSEKHVGQTKGLCGTFNKKQNDDFLTPDNIVESNANDFAVKWKVDPACVDKQNIVLHEHNCDLNPEKREEAEKLCGELFGLAFSECHSIVDPKMFYDDCLSDVCACHGDIKDCLCPVLSNYGSVCAHSGHPLFWRVKVPMCDIPCKGGQVYTECNNPCMSSCAVIAETQHKLCEKTCVEGCGCPSGTTLDASGNCIPISQCPCIFEDKEYVPASVVQQNNQVCRCSHGAWFCKVKTIEPIVVEEKMEAIYNCSGFKNMEFTDCVDPCQETCITLIPSVMCLKQAHKQCKPGCRCKKGYVLDKERNVCVKPQFCHCHHNGQSYSKGEVINVGCNRCKCNGQVWDCEQKECPGICSTWGESHFKSFDGRMFDFYGTCEYLLSKGRVDGMHSFRVVIRNMLCGTSGTACSKAVLIHLGKKTELVLSKDEPLPSSYDRSLVAIRKVGLFVVVETSIGLTVQWDGGTRVYVHLRPSWMSRVSGLCGNFNDDQEDDLQTPGGAPLNTANIIEFADSWRFKDSCPDSKGVIDSCILYSHRVGWAKSRCAVLRATDREFVKCHHAVDVEPYYERCLLDACSCDNGGDCECLCTAIAAYVQECNIRGISIQWRTQELCPIQCETCAEYKPCVSMCPRKTCQSRYSYEILAGNKNCAEEPCIEGCEYPHCNNSEIFDEVQKKCVPEADCICTVINGRAYKENERITDAVVTNGQAACCCRHGTVQCGKESCPMTCFKNGWTKWINTKPTFEGDFQLLDAPDVIPEYQDHCTLDYATAIECRLTSASKTSELGRQKTTCKLPEGFICNNKDQEGGTCDDYEIRLYCDCPSTYSLPPPTTTTSVPSTFTPSSTSTFAPSLSICKELGWTPWMNAYQADHSGDWETFPELRQKYEFCSNDYITNVDCREVGSNTQTLPSLRKYDTCSIEHGLSCTSRKGFECPDFEIRFYCQCEAVSECDFPRGMKDESIKAEQITASSHASPEMVGEGRLDHDIAWSPLISLPDEWIQVDFGEVQNVSGIITQGSPSKLAFVTSYIVFYSLDGVSFKTVTFRDGRSVEFEGNSDQNSYKKNMFPDMLRARYIRVMPYSWKGEISLRLEILGCNIVIPQTTILPSSTETPRTTTLPPCKPGWTQFFNMTNPANDIGDFELIDKIQLETGVCREGFIADIQCQAYVNGMFVNYKYTNDVGVQCTRSKGLVCLNEYQTDKMCKDYSVSLYCMCGMVTPSHTPETSSQTPETSSQTPETSSQTPETSSQTPETSSQTPETSSQAPETSSQTPETSSQAPTSPTVSPTHCGWTHWFNLDRPDITKDDLGDIELMDELQAVYGVCAKPDLKAIECRVKDSNISWVDANQNALVCDVNSGFSCYNNLQTTGCFDYEVRVLCFPVTCSELRISPTVPTTLESSTVTSTTPLETTTTFGTAPSILPGTETHPTIPTLLTSTSPMPTTQCTTITPTTCRAGEIPKAIVNENSSCIISYMCEPISTTPPPCQDGYDTCEMISTYFKTFDGSEYDYDICDHILFRDAHSNRFTVYVHKKCEDSTGDCCSKMYLMISVDDKNIRIGPDFDSISVNAYDVSVDNFWLLNRRLSNMYLMKVGNQMIYASLKYHFTVIMNENYEIKVMASRCDNLHHLQGLCGTYNHNIKDDFQKVDRTITEDVTAFGDSWAVRDPKICHNSECTEEELEIVDELCSLHSFQSSIFSSCLSVLDVAKYRERCHSAVCACLKSHCGNVKIQSPPTGCKCRALDILYDFCPPDVHFPPNWPGIDGCGHTCPPGLVWKNCGHGCEVTCDNYHERDTLQCSKECIPGCYCPEGLLHQGNKCIKPEQCYDCVCKGHGDPNYMTYDGLTYSFQGNCTYTLSQHSKFRIDSINKECYEEPGTTCLEGLTIYFEGNEVEILRNKPVVLNGKAIPDNDYPLSHDGIEVNAIPRASVIVSIPSISLVVTYYEINYGFIVQIPSHLYFGSTEGLCGNCNFDKTDDMMIQGGYVTDNVEDFAYSWLVEASRKECTLPPSPPPPTKVPPKPCLFPPSSCSFVVDPTPYERACQHDMQTSLNPNHTFCRSFLQYAQRCCERGISLRDLLKASQCGISCPNGMIEDCSCTRTCDDSSIAIDLPIAPSKQTSRCGAGSVYTCHCPEGMVFRHGMCIEEEECYEGFCTYKHLYSLKNGFEEELPKNEQYVKKYEAGDIWTDGNCLECTCEEEDGEFYTSCGYMPCGPPEQDLYVYTKELVPNQCCPNYKKIMCQVNGKTYKVGETWPSPDGNKCHVMECANVTSEVIQRLRIENCDNCKPHEVYVEPESTSSECCGHCKPVACEENGIIHQANTTWNSTIKSCYIGECKEENGIIKTSYIHVYCSPIPSWCPQEEIITDETGCCRKCRIDACVPVAIPSRQTIGYFKVQTPIGECSNDKAINNLKVCKGPCETGSQLTFSHSDKFFEHNCKCCQPTDSSELIVNLVCPDGSRIETYYDLPIECSCHSCSEDLLKPLKPGNIPELDLSQ